MSAGLARPAETIVPVFVNVDGGLNRSNAIHQTTLSRGSAKNGTSKSGSSIHLAVSIYEASKQSNSHCESDRTHSLDAPEAGEIN